MTQDEALRYCEERGIGPELTRAERQSLSTDDFRMFALAFSTGQAAELPNREWAQEVYEGSAARVDV